ncbi:MAG TPA: hypothetical protein VHY91_00030 [Pirellulales bacterium]|jgi:hypothetical protein|nr:hypothetical protein [Pirellulales bacterium]
MYEQPRSAFRLSHALVGAGVAALLVSTYRGQTELAIFLTWLMYAALLIRTMAWFKWSDLAMSICFLLIFLPLLALVFFIPPLIHT